MRGWQLWIVAWLVSFASSCIEVVRWKQQDVYLKYDAAADTAEMLLVYDQVFAGKPDDEALARATHAVEAIAARKRYFVIGDWPFEFELDGAVRGEDASLLKAIAAEAPTPGSPEAQGAEFLAGIEIPGASVHLAHDRWLTLVQRVRMPHFSLAVHAANTALSREFAAQASPTGEFTPEEWEAWRAYARSGKPWISLDAQGLEFQAPYGARWMAALLRYVSTDASGDVFTPALSAALTEVELRDGAAIFRWRWDDHGVLHLSFAQPRGDPVLDLHDDALALKLATSSLSIEREQRADVLVQRFVH